MTEIKAGLFLSDDPGPLWSVVRMPDGSDFEGAGNSIEEAEADARQGWRTWKAESGVTELATQMLERRVRRLFIVTCNWPHFDAWCHDIGAHPRDPRLVRLTEPRQIQGQHEPFYRAVDWPDRFSYGMRAHEMMAELRHRRAISIEDDDAAAWLEATAAKAPELPCRVYWGSHGCMHPRGHSLEIPHACDCCECEHHPDPDPGNPNSEPSCVAGPPYYGEHTRFYGEDAEALGLPLVTPGSGKSATR